MSRAKIPGHGRPVEQPVQRIAVFGSRMILDILSTCVRFRKEVGNYVGGKASVPFRGMLPSQIRSRAVGVSPPRPLAHRFTREASWLQTQNFGISAKIIPRRVSRWGNFLETLTVIVPILPFGRQTGPVRSWTGTKFRDPRVLCYPGRAQPV